MKSIIQSIFPQSISKEQSKDMGVVISLVMLFLGMRLDNWLLIKVAFSSLVVCVLVPIVFIPVAFLWFTLANILSSIMSRIVLTSVFILIVLPVAFVRKLLKKDSMQLYKWKKSTESVFIERNYLFTAEDLKKPF